MSATMPQLYISWPAHGETITPENALLMLEMKVSYSLPQG
jgi:hypothetical protein